jgi:hypothetical protein
MFADDRTHRAIVGEGGGDGILVAWDAGIGADKDGPPVGRPGRMPNREGESLLAAFADGSDERDEPEISDVDCRAVRCRLRGRAQRAEQLTKFRAVAVACLREGLRGRALDDHGADVECAEHLGNRRAARERSGADHERVHAPNPERRERRDDRPGAGIWVTEGAGIEDHGGSWRSDERARTTADRHRVDDHLVAVEGRSCRADGSREQACDDYCRYRARKPTPSPPWVDPRDHDRDEHRGRPRHAGSTGRGG